MSLRNPHKLAALVQLLSKQSIGLGNPYTSDQEIDQATQAKYLFHQVVEVEAW